MPWPTPKGIRPEHWSTGWVGTLEGKCVAQYVFQMTILRRSETFDQLVDDELQAICRLTLERLDLPTASHSGHFLS